MGTSVSSLSFSLDLYRVYEMFAFDLYVKQFKFVNNFQIAGNVPCITMSLIC